LKSRRQQLHRRIAEILREQFVAQATAEPEIVARHLTLAAMCGAAVEWWSKAGDIAIRRAAFAEAAAHFRKAIENADMPATDQSASVPLAARLKLQLAYASNCLLVRMRLESIRPSKPSDLSTRFVFDLLLQALLKPRIFDRQRRRARRHRQRGPKSLVGNLEGFLEQVGS